MIEANPRASRTVPFVSKAIGLPLAKLACRIMLGERLADLELPERRAANGHVCVKEVVLPFDRFAGADSLLGPEMRSTGEVMGIARDFPTAFAKAQAAAGARLPASGTVFITVADGDKPAATGIATSLHDLGFQIVATRGTAQAMREDGDPRRGDQQDRRGLAARRRLDRARRGRSGHQHAGRHRRARRRLRDPRAAVARGIPCITTMAGGMAAARAIAAARRGEPEVLSLQEIHAPAPVARPARRERGRRARSRRRSAAARAR